LPVRWSAHRHLVPNQQQIGSPWVSVLPRVLRADPCERMSGHGLLHGARSAGAGGWPMSGLPAGFARGSMEVVEKLGDQAPKTAIAISHLKQE
jgi:hypothetical protein